MDSYFIYTNCTYIFFHLYNILGSMENEEDVLDWMVSQKEDESIEDIDREILFEYINTKDFLAVIFCKYNFL